MSYFASFACFEILSNTDLGIYFCPLVSKLSFGVSFFSDEVDAELIAVTVVAEPVEAVEALAMSS